MSADSDAATVGVVTASSRLLWRWWDDDYVVYNGASGDSHVLNLVAGEALRSLEETPADAATLAERVAPTLALTLNDELVARMGQLIAQFEDLGLVDRVRS
jgi:PqqD family protein of HPr-rel-A system